MKCDLCKEKLIAFLYEDLSNEEKSSIETHVKKCSFCRKELKNLTETRQMLKAWPDQEPNLNLQFIHEKTSFWSWLSPEWLITPGWRKFAFGLAGALLLLLITLSALNFEASYTQGEFEVKLSLLPRQANQIEQPQDPLAMPVTRGEFDSWRAESFQMIQELVRETESRNRRDYRMALSEFARDLDSQRRRDLQWVGKGFELVHTENEHKIQRTQEVLNQLIQVAAYQLIQPDSSQNK